MCDESKKLKLLVGIGVILIMQLLLWTSVFAEYGGHDLGIHNSNITIVGINEKGQVAGYYQSLDGKADCGFVWENGKMTDLGDLGGNKTCVTAINNKGQVVGWSYLSDNTYHGFIWENGKMTDLDMFGGERSVANAINEKGQVVGYATTTDGVRHGFIWENGKVTDLGVNIYAEAINENGQIVGHLVPTGFTTEHAFIWENGKVKDLGALRGYNSRATSINNKGIVIGYYWSGDYREYGFIWEDGTMIDLGDLEGLGGQSKALAINNNDQVVGCINGKGFIWEGGKVTFLTPGDVLSEATAINDKCQVVGCFWPKDAADWHGFIWEDGKTTDLGTLGGNYSKALAVNNRGQVVGLSTIENKGRRALIWSEDYVPTPESTPVPALYPSEIQVNTSKLTDDRYYTRVSMDYNKLLSINNGSGTLTSEDYYVRGDEVVISNSYIKYYFNKFPNQNLYLKFNFASRKSTMLTIYTGDTPHVVMTDSLSYKVGSSDANLNMVPNGNFITNVKNGDSTLIPRIDYTFIPSINTFIIRKGYLNSCFTKTSEPLKLTVSFTGDAPKTIVINPEK